MRQLSLGPSLSQVPFARQAWPDPTATLVTTRMTSPTPPIQLPFSGSEEDVRIHMRSHPEDTSPMKGSMNPRE